MDITTNNLNKNWPFIFVISCLVILLIVSVIFNLMKCDDLRGRITLGELYNDFKGNKDPNARMTAQVDISTKEGACSFDVLYEYDGFREVNSNSITPPLSDAEQKENDKDICKRYQYPSGERKFYDRLLDAEYLSRH